MTSCTYSVSGILLNNNMADKTRQRKSKGERIKRKEEKRKRKHSENDDIELAKHYETLLVYDFLYFCSLYCPEISGSANAKIVHKHKLKTKVNKVLNFTVTTFL